jgi:hypothetical protein
MTKYPYADPEKYPMTAARRAYIDKYNTRVVHAEIPSIDTLAINRPAFPGAAQTEPRPHALPQK